MKRVRFRRYFAVLGVSIVGGGLCLASPATADDQQAAGQFVAVTPSVVGDTADGSGALGSAPFAAGESRTVVLSGSYGVPSTGVSAVAVEIASENAASTGAFDLYADDASDPAVPALSYSSGETDSGFDFVALGSDGGITITSNGGSADLAMTVEGYFTDGSTTAPGGYVPIAEANLMGVNGTTLNPGQTESISVPSTSVPSTASAVFAEIKTSNATGTSGGSVSVYSDSSSPPSEPTLVWNGSGSTSGATVQFDSTEVLDVTNTGSAATQIKLAIDGYFAGDTSGAGFFITADSLSPVTVPAAGSADVPVADMADDLPSAAVIQDAVLNLGVAGTTAVGQLDVEPCGGSVAPVPAMTYRRVDENALTLSQLGGSDGCVTLINSGSVAVNVSVEVQGWFQNPNAQNVTPTQLYSSTAGTSVTVDPTTGAVTYTGLSGAETDEYDASGNLISSTDDSADGTATFELGGYDTTDGTAADTTDNSASYAYGTDPLSGAKTIGKYACVVPTKQNDGLVAGKVGYLTYPGNSHYAQYQFNPYGLKNARYVGGQWTFQWDWCVVGGGTTKNGFHQYWDGSGVELQHSGSEVLGHKWATKVNNDTVNGAISFSVSAGPVTVSASENLVDHGGYAGELGPDDNLCHDTTKCAFKNTWENNEASSYYHSSASWLWDGTSAWEGNVLQALYEWPMSGGGRGLSFEINQKGFCADWPDGLGCPHWN